MEILEEVAPLLRSLATSSHVYAKCGAVSDATIAEQTFDLVAVAQGDWAHQAVAGAVGPASAREIESALEHVNETEAIELMTNLSALDLVYSRQLLRDPDHARRAATRVAKLLGRGTSWVTNTEGIGNGRAWTPVTRHGIDVQLTQLRGAQRGTSSEAAQRLLQNLSHTAGLVDRALWESATAALEAGESLEDLARWARRPVEVLAAELAAYRNRDED